MKSCLATLNTMNSESYKKFLQEKLVSWFALFPDVRAAPKAAAPLWLETIRKLMKERRGALRVNSLWCNEVLPPKTAAEPGQRVRK